jgi:hypothetical protein
LITTEDGEPLVTIVIEPVELVAVEGSKVALNVTLAPAAKVVFVLRPLCPKPAPVTLI